MSGGATWNFPGLPWPYTPVLPRPSNYLTKAGQRENTPLAFERFDRALFLSIRRGSSSDGGLRVDSREEFRRWLPRWFTDYLSACIPWAEGIEGLMYLHQAGLRLNQGRGFVSGLWTEDHAAVESRYAEAASTIFGAIKGDPTLPDAPSISPDLDFNRLLERLHDWIRDARELHPYLENDPSPAPAPVPSPGEPRAFLTPKGTRVEVTKDLTKLDRYILAGWRLGGSGAMFTTEDLIAEADTRHKLHTFETHWSKAVNATGLFQTVDGKGKLFVGTPAI